MRLNRRQLLGAVGVLVLAPRVGVASAGQRGINGTSGTADDPVARTYYEVLLRHTRWAEQQFDPAAGHYRRTDFGFAVVLGNAVLLTRGTYDAGIAGVRTRRGPGQHRRRIPQPVQPFRVGRQRDGPDPAGPVGAQALPRQPDRHRDRHGVPHRPRRCPRRTGVVHPRRRRSGRAHGGRPRRRPDHPHRRRTAGDARPSRSERSAASGRAPRRGPARHHHAQCASVPVRRSRAGPGHLPDLAPARRDERSGGRCGR